MAEAVWTNRERAELSRLRQMRQLFRGDHEVYFVLPNGQQRRYEYVTTNWLGDTLSQTWKRLLFRKFPLLATGNAQADKAVADLVGTLRLPVVCQPAALMVSWAGRATFKLYWSRLRRQPALRLWGANETEFATWDYLASDHSQPIAVNCWYLMAIPGDRDKRQAYVRERHELLYKLGRDGEVKITTLRVTNVAYRVEGGQPVDEIIAWERMYPDEATRPAETEDLTGMTMLPVIAINNVDSDGDEVGESDYTKSLINLQKNVNKLVASRQFVIDVSERPMIEVPPEYLDDAGQIDWEKVALRVKYDGEEGAGAEIKVTNWAGHLANSAEQYEIYRREFRSQTGIAAPLLGDTTQDGSGGESGYARRLGMVATEAEVTFRRAAWERGFQDIIAVAQQLQAVFLGGKAVKPVEQLTVGWQPAIPEDSTEVSNAVVAEAAGGVRSLESAIERLNPDATEEWRAQELERIQEREATAMARNPFRPEGQGDEGDGQGAGDDAGAA